MSRPSVMVAGLAGLAVILTACAERRDATAPERADAPSAAAAREGARALGAPPGYNTVAVSVPPALRTPPFDVARTLTIPTSYAIGVVARIPSARFLAVTPDNALLVSVPSQGQIMLVRRSPQGAAVSTFRSGLKRPHDIVFASIGGTTYVYFTESNQVSRAPYVAGDLTMRASQVLVSNLPEGALYSHPYKNIAVDVTRGALYVSIGSSCNVCASDPVANPVRGSVYVYGLDGSGGRLYARGVRNAEGLAVHSTSGTLWMVVNSRDQIPYPFQDATGNYGRVFPGYVDDHPPDEFIGARDGGDYGWPFCNPNPDTPSGLNDMPFDDDYNQNRGGSMRNCATMDRVQRGIQAHSAPLGMSLLQSTTIDPYYRQGALVALHGSWNRSTRTGAKVVYFTWDALTQRPTQQYDFVSGWNSGAGYWGRPVDAVVDPLGGVLISDDLSGTIYRLRQTGVVP